MKEMADMTAFEEISQNLTTESKETGDHTVFF